MASTSTSTSNNRDPYLAELVQFSSRALLRKPAKRSPTPYYDVRSPEPHSEALHLSAFNWLSEPSSETELTNAQITADINDVHAQPLMPLRQRDLEALTGLFGADGIEAIELDIANGLKNRRPEPCWEDDPFKFLQEYL
jgi:hypothetical protein